MVRPSEHAMNQNVELQKEHRACSPLFRLREVIRSPM